MRDLIYDIESYPNVFCITFLDPKTNNYKVFEVSEWKDEWESFRGFLVKCQMNFTGG